MAVLDQIELPNGTTYDISDASARKLDNNDFDTINVTELNAGDVIVTGAARFLNTINGDISGNAETATSATKATQDESGNNIKSTYANAISISDHTITLKNKNGTSLGTVTVPDNNTTYTVATGTANGKIKVTPSSGSAYEVPVYGLKSAAYKNVTDTYSETGTDPVSGKAVKSAIDGLPSPMVFRGTVGTGGTITNVPTDGTAVVGDTYKVITNGVYGGKTAKVGDTLICLTKTSTANTWELVPSGDEPSGTVTSVAVANGGGLSVSGSPITSSGTITVSHADTSSQASVNNSGRTYIQDITLDTYGHVTGIASATETVINTDRYVNSAAFADATSADANNPVKMTLIRAGSDTASVTAYLPKVGSSSAGVAPKGAAVSSQSQSTKFLREDGTWAAPSYTTNTNTTYNLSASGENVVLTGSDSSSKSVSLSALINGLSEGASPATSGDYIVAQYAGGGTTTKTYHRRKLSNIFKAMSSNDITTALGYTPPHEPVKDIPNTPTPIASFTDGASLPMASLKVAVTPYQDLHGYDGPWAGGAGKNKFDADAVYATFKQADGSFDGLSGHITPIETHIPANLVGHQLTFSAYLRVPSGSTVTSLRVLARVNGVSLQGDFINSETYALSAVTFTPESTEDIVKITYGSNGDQRMQFKNIQLELGSTATSFAPYSNICPIIGWDEAVVNITGINIWDEEWEVGGIGSIDGRDTPDTDTIRSKNFISVLPNTQYYIGCQRQLTGWVRQRFYDAEKNYIGYTGQVTNNGVFTTANNCYYMRFATYASGGYGTTYNNDISINYPSTDTSYHAYNGATYTIDLNGTRYGGTLDATNGTLVVNREIAVFDGSNDENWQSDTDGTSNDGFVCFRAYLRNDNIKKPEGTISTMDYIGKMFSSTMPTLKNGYVNQYPMANTVMGITGYSGPSNNYFYLNVNKTLSNIQSVAELRAWLAENPTTVCYELATPITVQLSPTQVKSLEGENNISANCGQITEGKYVVQDYSDITSKISEFAQLANTASKLGSSNVGSATQPIYLNAGTATACTYTLGKSVPSDAVFIDTKNTAGSTDTSSKIFLIGATSQAANPQTYSDNEIYTTSGVLTTKSVRVGGGSATMEYDTTTQSINFIFN